MWAMSRDEFIPVSGDPRLVSALKEVGESGGKEPPQD